MTLVVPSMGPSLALVFTPDNPCNSTITDQNTDEVLFRVSTEKRSGKITTFLNNDQGTTLASWEWHEVRPDILRLGDADAISSSVWLHKSMNPFVDTVTFTDEGGRQLKWKGFSEGSQPRMYISDDKWFNKYPIVVFRPSYKLNCPAPNTMPATLTLRPRAPEIMIPVVISFLMLEKTRRLTNKKGAIDDLLK
ncbi:hypothetical protein BJ165DRAFT_1402393 [Panaeolus papilionaceus]|nr:hypothetical protein BJ165DRAFT_1402393 [Panaeolus papilionaceus]